VSSYLPFLEDAPAVTHGAGRRAFGGFGEKPEEEAEELEEDSDEEALAAIMGNDEEMQDVVPTRKEKSKGKEKAKEKAKKPKAKAGDEVSLVNV
jgi:hypothetical protein